MRRASLDVMLPLGLAIAALALVVFAIMADYSAVERNGLRLRGSVSTVNVDTLAARLDSIEAVVRRLEAR